MTIWDTKQEPETGNPPRARTRRVYMLALTVDWDPDEGPGDQAEDVISEVVDTCTANEAIRYGIEGSGGIVVGLYSMGEITTYTEGND